MRSVGMIVTLSLWIDLLLCIALPVVAQDAGQVDPFYWGQPFQHSLHRQEMMKRALDIVVVTNDQPSADQNSSVEADAWCAELLEDSMAKLRVARPDLAETLFLQTIPAGLPTVVTGGRPLDEPKRAIVAICDYRRRILAVAVGVPELNQWLSMVEDAEELRNLFEQNSDDPDKFLMMAAERSSQRLGRAWNKTLDELLNKNRVARLAAFSSDKPAIHDANWHSNQIRELTSTTDSVLFADVVRRFNLNNPNGRQTRMVLLEQHLEPRQPWCETLIPFLFGADFDEAWRPLVESIWGYPPVSDDVDIRELLAWFDDVRSSAVVLSIKPPDTKRDSGGPPPEPTAHDAGWRKAIDHATAFPFRAVYLDQLAVLMQQRGIKPIHLFQPTAARYVLIDAAESRAIVVRASDPPGRLVASLRRFRSPSVTK